MSFYVKCNFIELDIMKNKNYSEILKEIEEKYSGVMVVLEGGTRIPLFEFSAFDKDLI